MEPNLLKYLAKSSKDPQNKNKPSLLLLWICIFILASVLMTLFIAIGAYDLITSIWALVIGIGMIQTGNIFRSYYWSGKLWYLFGFLLFLFGIFFAFIIPIQEISVLLQHVIMGSGWIAEGLRGRIENGKRTR
jgi:hypothetical protein